MADQGPLREQLRRKFERERLDDRQYERLRATMAPRPRLRRPPLWWAAAATIACVLAVAALVLPLREPSWQVDQIVRHVTHYHLQDPPLEVEATSLPALRAGLDRLDFQPVLPANAGNWRLQGGRHCTLLGGVASQLRFLSDDGQRVSLYEAAYDPQRFGPLPALERGESALEVARNGLSIRIWVESGIVMAEIRAPRAGEAPLPPGGRHS